MRRIAVSTRGALIATLVTTVPAWAQQAPVPAPFQYQNPQAITTPQGRAASESMLSTKPADEKKTLPWQQPAPPQQPAAVAVTPPGVQAMPAAIPFGRSTASQYQPIPEGPHTAVAVPVENIEAIEASEPAPAIHATDIADPANEDPAAPTELTAPIFAAQETLIPRTAVIRVLNKVTARAQTLHIKPGATEKAGKIQVSARYCQYSAESSLPDAATLVEVADIAAEQEKPKLLFSGWIYLSSPSVSAMEHPVYDVMLMGCQDTQAKPNKAPKTKKK